VVTEFTNSSVYRTAVILQRDAKDSNVVAKTDYINLEFELSALCLTIRESERV